MQDSHLDRQQGAADQSDAGDDKTRTPGSMGHPEPGSGHDDSKTTTVEEGPPIKKTDGVPGAFGDVEIDRQP